MVLVMKIIVNEADLGLFLKTGIVVLSFVAILFSGIKYIPTAVTVSNHTNSKKFPINSVETSEKVVALTFDIDSVDGHLDAILDILNNKNVKATFFITGKWIDSNPDGLIKLVNEGHTIGNHSNNHKYMELLSLKECEEEILYVHNRVKEITGIEMTLFRPPYGHFDNTIIHTAKELGYETINWDIDSQDWKDYGVGDVIKQTVDNKDLKKGSIILFHTGTKYTSKALEQIIVSLHEKEYKLQPLSELIHQEDYVIDVTGRQTRIE